MRCLVYVPQGQCAAFGWKDVKILFAKWCDEEELGAVMEEAQQISATVCIFRVDERDPEKMARTVHFGAVHSFFGGSARDD